MDNRLTPFALLAALALVPRAAFCGESSAPVFPLGSTPGAPRSVTPSKVRGGSAERAVLTALGSIDSANASSESVSQAIVQLGSEAVDPLLDVLILGKFAEPVGEFGNVTRSVQRAHLSAMTQSIKLLPWESVRGIIAKRFHPSEPLRSRLILCRLLAEVAPAADLSMLGAAVSGDGKAIPRDAHRSYGTALARWIHRDPEAVSHFPELVKTVHPSLLRISIEALRGGEDEAALSAMCRSLGVHARYDATLLMEIADQSKTARRPAATEVLANIRPFVTSLDPNCALEAVSALGRLDDVGAVESLIAQMKSDSPTMRSRAKEALEILADERIGSDASAWANWFVAATEWHETVAPEVTLRLRNGPVTQRSQALLEFARYRVFRHDLDETIIEALKDRDEGIVIIACAVLGHYATVPATNALVEALDAESVKVRKAALEALHRSTGKRHGELRSEWIAAGFGTPTEDAAAAPTK